MLPLNKITAQKDGTGKSDVQIRDMLVSLSNSPLISRNILVSLSNSPLIPHTPWVEGHPYTPIQLRYLKPALVPFPKLSGAYGQASPSIMGFGSPTNRFNRKSCTAARIREGRAEEEGAMDWPSMAARACGCGGGGGGGFGLKLTGAVSTRKAEQRWRDRWCRWNQSYCRGGALDVVEDAGK
jgi:hypothetical protein